MECGSCQEACIWMNSPPKSRSPTTRPIRTTCNTTQRIFVVTLSLYIFFHPIKTKKEGTLHTHKHTYRTPGLTIPPPVCRALISSAPALLRQTAVNLLQAASVFTTAGRGGVKSSSHASRHKLADRKSLENRCKQQTVSRRIAPSTLVKAFLHHTTWNRKPFEISSQQATELAVVEPQPLVGALY